MTIQEALQEIDKQPKAWAFAVPSMRPSTYTTTRQRIEDGRAKPVTVQKFFSRFGYEGEWNNWSKIVKDENAI